MCSISSLESDRRVPVTALSSPFSIQRCGVVSALIVSLMLAHTAALASPMMKTGDSLLRHDVQVLADHGVLTGPVTTWPLSWGPVVQQIREYRGDLEDAAVAMAIARLQARARWEARSDELTFSAEVGVAESPARIRGYQDTLRGNAEAGLGVAWAGDRVAVSLQAQVVDKDAAGSEAWADGSMIGFAFGNYSVSVNTLDRWWGPGWDGSIILSNNSRPIPAFSIDRNFTDPFPTKWLSWLGPWDLNVMIGALENQRHIPNALFFGMRFNVRPLQSLEIGLSRTAQWCGDGRPCDISTFGDLLLGQDNRGDDGLDASTEPGNQLAGVDFRWAPRISGRSPALYGQFVGEDEAGGLPSRWLGQVGVEVSGVWRDHWSWRWFGEFAGTSCQFYETSEIFDCAYNHSIYRTGYRYRGQSIGHGADNDARLLSSGVVLANSENIEWRVLARVGKLNRGGVPDSRNTVTAAPQDIKSIDLGHRREIRYGIIDIAIGAELRESATDDESDVSFHIQWRSAY